MADELVNAEIPAEHHSFALGYLEGQLKILHRHLDALAAYQGDKATLMASCGCLRDSIENLFHTTLPDAIAARIEKEKARAA